MNNLLNYLQIGSLSLILTNSSVAMPGRQHDQLGYKLQGTSVKRGGIAKMSISKMEAINRWIDNPATKTGQYNLRSSGRPISPWNHNELRHNPFKVARVFSGTGQIDKATLNAARLHKIGDMAANSRPVDGWFITPARQAEAKEIIKYVERNNRLPKKLPAWVDREGVESLSRVTRNPSGSRASKGFSKSASSLRSSVRPAVTGITSASGSQLAAACNAAIVSGGLVFVVDTGIELYAYSQNNISHGDLKRGMKETGIRAGSVGAATGVLYLCASSPHGLVVIGVCVGAYVVSDYAINVCVDHFGTTPMNLSELRGILPDDIINQPMIADFFMSQ